MDAERIIEVMGIVNLTDDSYFADSRCGAGTRDSVRLALARVEDMLEQGAAVIDLGACSTRPGSQPVGPQEEWRRLEPVLKALATSYPEVRVSVDTVYSEVISKAFGLMSEILGAEWARRNLIVNDISAGEDDPEMLPLVGRLQLSYIAMHKRGNPADMQTRCDYEDVTSQVKDYFESFALKAESYGINDWILDPGFGFAKTVGQNYQLLRELDSLASCGVKGAAKRRILVGVSRKSMIYRKLGITPEESLPATQVLHLKALQKGADILRAHDVAEAVRTVSLYRALE